MASGMQDYQSIVRPKYGGALEVDGGPVVPINVVTTLVSVSGKGMIYGGFIAAMLNSTQRDSVPIIEVDGIHIVATSFFYLNYLGVKNPGAYPIVMSVYDDVDFIYAVGISYGITFENGITLKYNENHGTTPVVFYSLVYALL